MLKPQICPGCEQKKTPSSFMQGKTRKRICAQCRYQRYEKVWRVANIERHWDRQFQRVYGITLREWVDLAARQQFRCALCRADLTVSPPKTDHDHKTGKVRGILCNECNLDLGKVERLLDKADLEKVMDYLCPTI